MKRTLTFLTAFVLISPAAFSVEMTPNQTEKPEVIGTIKNWTQDSSLKISLPVTKFQLKNGLTVLLHEDRSVPMVSYHTWYKVGSRDEQPGVTGAAHMLEHMMFKGAKKYDGKSFDRIFHENGIINNAFTTNDYTGFYENLPSSKLELVMDMEVDRMSSLLLSPEDVKTEKEVVKEERRLRVDNNPMGVLREVMMGTLFKTHPYKWPVIGYMKDIEAYDAEKLRYFYNNFYGPNNAVLILVGDFDTAKTRALIEKYYSRLPERAVPVQNFPEEKKQTAQQNATVRKDVQNASFFVAFKSPPRGSPDVYALDLAGAILGSGSSSRLHKRLVYQKQIATSAYSYNLTMKDSGIFGVGAGMKPGLEPQEAMEIVYNEIWKMRHQKVSPQELEKAKTLVMKDVVDNLQTIDGKARALAENEIMTGSYDTLFTDLEKYQAVTVDDIQRVMNLYTQQTQRSIITLLPKK